MSKYTVPEIMAEADMQDDHVADMLRDYAALLHERESSKVTVTDEMVSIAAHGYDSASPSFHPSNKGMRAALEAVAPMLASARVPDARKLRLNGNVRQQSFDHGWNACRDAMLAAAMKPGTEG